MKKNKTIYQILLDQSGSMRSKTLEVIEGFNDQIERLKEIIIQDDNEELRVALSCFNDHVYHRYKDLTLAEVARLTLEDYSPSGMTALLDAIGESIYNIRSIYEKEIEEGSTSVVYLIFTDGMENASKSFSFKQIRDLIEELESTDMWLFSFVGSDIQGVEFASELSIKRENTRSFNPAFTKNSLLNFSKDLESYMALKKSFRKPPKKLFK